MDLATSADGTRIAYDVLGEGPPLVLVSGIFCNRRRTAPLAAAFGRAFRCVNYDRRGRGESTDTPPYAVAREVEDLAALLGVLGGEAAVYGHSSGAGLALEAAAAGLPITRLVLHEPPYGPDDEESREAARRLARDVAAAVAEGRAGDAVRRFLDDSGLPGEVVAAMATDPALLGQAGSMPYDHAVVRDGDGGAVPVELARSVTAPTLVLTGDESEEFFRATAVRLVDLLPEGRLGVLGGHGHDAPPDVVARAVADFLLG